MPIDETELLINLFLLVVAKLNELTDNLNWNVHNFAVERGSKSNECSINEIE